jgi:hypothetical protein
MLGKDTNACEIAYILIQHPKNILQIGIWNLWFILLVGMQKSYQIIIPRKFNTSISPEEKNP